MFFSRKTFMSVDYLFLKLTPLKLKSLVTTLIWIPRGGIDLLIFSGGYHVRFETRSSLRTCNRVSRTVCTITQTFKVNCLLYSQLVVGVFHLFRLDVCC